MGSVLPSGEPDDGPDAPDTAAVEPPQADQPARAPASPPGGRWRRRRRRILIWGWASLAVMIVHIPADRKWAEVVSIPRDSWVHIPACTMGDGQLSAPTQFKINEAFAIGNLDGNHTALGVACTVKTVEQDTGIYINHFIAVNFTGFENMVAALGGVYECNPTPINDPNSNLHLAAGTHLLTPAQALGYVRARYTLGDGSDLERIGRQ